MAYDAADLDAALANLETHMAEGRSVASPKKSVQHLSEDLEQKDLWQRMYNDRVADDLAILRREVTLARREGGHTKKQLKRLAKGLWATMGQHRGEARGRAPSEASRQLATELRTQFPDDMEKALQYGILLKGLFGPKGGQAVKYNKETAARLLLAKALNAHELALWKAMNRLPDHINVHTPQAIETPPAPQPWHGIAALVMPRALVTRG